MAANETDPKQTNQGGEGRKDERKGVDVGRDIPDHSDAGNAQAPEGDKSGTKQTEKGGRNSQGGQWGENKGRGGNDSHNKR